MARIGEREMVGGERKISDGDRQPLLRFAVDVKFLGKRVVGMKVNEAGRNGGSK